MITQKYKQSQRQVRVQTSESNYLKGMLYDDHPLAEGYSKVLVNCDIDSVTGKLTPRKGFHSFLIGVPKDNYLYDCKTAGGYTNLSAYKICTPYGIKSSAQKVVQYKKHLLAVMHNTNNRSAALLDISDVNDKNKYMNRSDVYATVINGVHKGVQTTIIPYESTKDYTERMIGTFAYNNSYYTFLGANIDAATLIYKGSAPNLGTYLPDIGNPGEFYSTHNTYGGSNTPTISTEPSAYDDYIIYYDSAGNKAVDDNFRFAGDKKIEYINRYANYAIVRYFEDYHPDINTIVGTVLCYTKLGADIKKSGDTLLEDNLTISELIDDKYYTCIITPQKLNPSEAASWGYNMLLEDPYQFDCKETAVNNITILGILPYDENNKICLTPRKNQRITLKGYYRAPREYHSDMEVAKYYATSKMELYFATKDSTPDISKTYYTYSNGVYYKYTNPVFVSGTTYYEKLDGDPESLEAVKTKYADATRLLTNYSYGAWCYCKEEAKYYIMSPKHTGTGTTKEFIEFGDTKPGASERLSAEDSGDEDKIHVRWQIRHSGASDWIDLDNQEFTLSDYYSRFGEFTPFTVTTQLPTNETMVRLLITDPKDIESYEEYTLSTMTIGLSAVSDELAESLNLQPVKYDLGTCGGMLEWEQRLVVWGVHDAENILFVSDINNPTFFPYPNNIDTFSDPILAVYNFGNELLVLTTSALYRLTFNTDGTGWSHKIVQNNLRVSADEAKRCCVVKNMFMFMSDKQCYLLVPKATSTQGVVGSLTVAPISKSIKNLLDNFDNEIKVICEILLDSKFVAWLKLNDTLDQVFSNNNKIIIQNTYSYTLDYNTPAIKLMVQLIYDTDTRAWSMYIFEINNTIYPIIDNNVQDVYYLTMIDYDYTSSTKSCIAPTFCDFRTNVLITGTITQDYLKKVAYMDLILRSVTEVGGMYAPYLLGFKSTYINNYQYIDTGNREINTDLKKRFREFQFKLKNTNSTNLGLLTSFLIDGSLRRDLQKFEPRYIMDESTGEAVIIVERTLDNSIAHINFVPEYKITRVEQVIIPNRMLQDSGATTETVLSENEDPDHWVIDQSAFPGKDFYKIRVAVSGKGYTPRAKLLMTNMKPFELYGHSWVYRTMNGR